MFRCEGYIPVPSPLNLTFQGPLMSLLSCKSRGALWRGEFRDGLVRVTLNVPADSISSSLQVEHLFIMFLTKSSNPRILKAEGPVLAMRSVWARERCCSTRTPSSCFTRMWAASMRWRTRMECTGETMGRQEMPKTSLTKLLAFLVMSTDKPLMDSAPLALPSAGRQTGWP